MVTTILSVRLFSHYFNTCRYMTECCLNLSVMLVKYNGSRKIYLHIINKYEEYEATKSSKVVFNNTDRQTDRQAVSQLDS
jgi:hypothetical protein